KNLPAQSPYGDIKTDDPRFPVVMWARQRGITWDWSDGNFHYDAPANDTTTVIMAYRLAGSPKVNLPDKNPPDAVYPWEERHHNLPYGSELHRAYVWLEFTGDGRTYLPSGVATVDDLWFNAWTFKATHTQAFEVLRLADIRGAF
ncbi:MAG: heme peroxidase, partial [Rothia mucilaginosa]